MIMPNDNNAIRNEDDGVRKFNDILRVAQSHWGELDYDCSNKIARGLLATKRRDPYIGELSYNDVKDHLFLTVRIAAPNAFAPTRTEALQKFANSWISLGHITLDREDQIVSVRAATVISESATRHAVESIFADTLGLLEDEDLHHLLA